MRAKYIALSYCWGPCPQVLTLKENIGIYRSNIPIETLSKTCRDAIRITHLLGYDYLWIDAICIVQNDDGDKGPELGRMGQIYRYAVLTICVEASPGAHTGIFPDDWTDPCEVYPCEVTMKAETIGGTVARRITVAGTRNGDDLLSKRGWTLQEAALTSRALVFGQGVTSWRCASATASETDPVLKPLPLDPYSNDSDNLPYELTRSHGSSIEVARIRAWLYKFPATRQLASSHLIEIEHPAFTAWYALIEGYSDRELTFVTDTLPAVQGIATVLGDSLGTPYTMGLWSADLSRGLLWYVAANDDRHIMSSSAVLDALKIPSWSWAAVGKVRVRFCALRLVADDWTPVNLAQISSVPESGPDPQGKWRLRVKGPTRMATLVLDNTFSEWRTSRTYGNRDASENEDRYAQIYTEGVYPRTSGFILDPGSVENEVIGEAALDSFVKPRQVPSLTFSWKMEVLCAALQSWQSDDRKCWACLLLEPVNGDTCYRRLGIGFLYTGDSGNWLAGSHWISSAVIHLV
ncbi:hypothetical protein PG984_008396 [Apiospora sp. TS-2023a]